MYIWGDRGPVHALAVLMEDATHRRPFVGVSQVRSWSYWCAFVNIWRESPTFPEKSVKIDF